MQKTLATVHFLPLPYKPFITASVVIAACLLYFMHAGDGSLKAWDEALTAIRSYEMATNNLFPTTTMLGQPDFNKPPLYYLLTSFVIDAIGINNLSVRLVSIVMAILTQIFIFKIVCNHTKCYSLRLFSVTLLLFNAHWMDHVRMGLLESGVAMSMFSAIYVAGHNTLRTKMKPFYIGVLLGFGCLVKQPGVLLALLPIALTMREHNRNTWIASTIRAAAIALAIYFAWLGHQMLMWGDKFFDYYIDYNVIKRFGEGIEGHATKISYYVDRLFMKAPVTGVLFFISLPWCLRDFLKSKRLNTPCIFLLTYTIVFITLHFLASKREPYLISLYPFLALAFPLSIARCNLSPRVISYIVIFLTSAQIAFFIPRFDVVPDYSRNEKEAFSAAKQISPDVIGIEGMQAPLAAYYGFTMHTRITLKNECISNSRNCNAIIFPSKQPQPEGFENAFNNS